MSVLILIVSIILCVAAMAADVHSSWINNPIPEISESNRFFRRIDGRCNIPKLIVWKIILLAIVGAATFVVMQLKDGDKLAFLVFLAMAAITALTARKNYKLHRKYTK